MEWSRVVRKDESGVIELGLIDGQADDTTKDSWRATMKNGLLILASNVTIKNLSLSRLHVGVEIRGDNVTIDGWDADMLSGDIIQGNGSNVKILNGRASNLISVLPYSEYHPDLIHFRGGNEGLIDGIKVIPSKHKWGRKDYQGCMFSDSSFRGWKVKNLKLPDVHLEHAVTFAEGHGCCVENSWGGGAVRFRDLNGIKSTGCKAYNVDGPVIGAEKPVADPHKERIVRGEPMFETKKAAVNHMQIAQAEQGISEIKGADHNQRIVGYFQATDYKATDDETPWCSAFVNWVLMQSGVPRTKSAAALSFKSWGVKCKPHYGCIVVIPRGSWKGHVGFLVSEDDTYYHILGGNQNDEVNVASFSKQEHQFFFRCCKKAKDSSSLKVDAARIATGTVTAGGGAYEAMRPKNPDVGGAEDAADKAVGFIPPEGYLLIPEYLAYGLVGLGIALILSSLYTRSERKNKLEEYGI